MTTRGNVTLRMYTVKQTPPLSAGHQIRQPAPHHRHPELVSGSVLTEQTPDTEINSA
ncbi:hypothetical protein H4J45_13035 [Colwellia sp. BRX10-6]|uniref:hypothetical protein n=1 Tax=unclassified Colwellia TaxID=196834 RepID=UPI0015F7122D|nr:MULTISPECIES: hypothetical protein [unclassified Colwellia]MBA6384484.1 hypothetical protein [Colwellia sp. BRX10-9]MBA6395012.1 hypothetical protein [Colwellia sp. BRX10-6]